MKNSRKALRLIAVLGITMFMTACLSTASYQSLYMPLEAEVGYQMPASEQETFSAEEVISSWWDSLNDAQLSELIDTALVHNNDVGIAIANLELARTQLRESTLGLLPDIGTRVSATDQRLADISQFGAGGSRFTSYEAGFDASWELDLFGRLRLAREASRADLQATQAELDEVYVSVAAEVARAYIQLRGAQLRLAVGERNVEVIASSADLTQQLMDGGLGDNLDVQRAKAQLELARSSLPGLRADVVVNINRLSVLTGEMPSALQESLTGVQDLPTIPPSIAIGDPMHLLQRRPDIRQAERRLASSISSYQVSVAELYPTVSITGSIGFLATAFADLGSGGTVSHLLGPQISWEAFDLGRVQNRVDAADSIIQGRLQVFEQTVLTSFEEVDNAMTTLSAQMQRQNSLRVAADSSARSSDLARQRYELGEDSFLDLLDAQRTQLQAEDQLASSEIEVALAVISLYKALGGGWEMQSN